jgi:hypothetical protein
VHSCGTVRPHGHRELSHPGDPGFYTVGVKSYGRAPDLPDGHRLRAGAVGGGRAGRRPERFLAPNYRRHRAAFQNIGDMNGVHHHGDDAMPDRQNVVVDMTAKGDKVWAIWRVVGHHQGDWYGIAGTGRPVDVLEAGMWRIENGLIAEGWFFGDELGLLRQIGMYPTS